MWGRGCQPHRSSFISKAKISQSSISSCQKISAYDSIHLELGHRGTSSCRLGEEVVSKVRGFEMEGDKEEGWRGNCGPTVPTTPVFPTS